MQMPCCTCLKTVCRRRDGTALVFFERGQTTDTASASGTPPAVCIEEGCCLTGLGRSDAATWKYGNRSITAIGADHNEVIRLTQWLDEQHPAAAITLQ
jgi:hypothetical protein